MQPYWPASLQNLSQWLDQRALGAAYSLQAPPEAPVKVVVAELPDDVLQAFVANPADHTLTEELKAVSNRDIGVGVFLPSAFRPNGYVSAEDISQALAVLEAPDASPAQADQLRLRLAQLARWQDFLEARDIHWFLPWGQLAQGSGEPVNVMRATASWQAGALQWLFEPRAIGNELHPFDWQFGRYAFLGAGPASSMPLWWKISPTQHIAGAPLLFAADLENLSQFEWQAGLLTATAAKGNWQRSVARDGYLPVDFRLTALSAPMAAAEAHLQGADLLLVTGQDSRYAQLSAAALNTLLANHYPKSPAWGGYWSVGFILVLGLLFAPLAFKARTAVFVLSVIILLALLIGLQIGAQVYYQWWLPVGVGVLFVVTVSGLRLAAGLLSWPARRLQASWAQAWQRILREQIKAGQLAEAEKTISDVEACRPEPWQLAVKYELAQGYEKQRRYDQAESLYASILSRSARFADVKARLKRLQEISKNPAGTGLDATLVIDEQIINKPVLGRYEIQKELGRGAMGVVYLARDPRIGRMVAVKTLHYKHFEPNQLDGVKARFFREAEAAGRLSHPNIVSVFDVGEEADLAYIAMDFVPGRALNFYCSPERLLPVPIVYGLMAKAADALFYAHKHQIVHRDIKPSNLLYDAETGRMKVSDFGIARLVDNSKTRTGDVMGSPLYMSPEQLKGARVGESADIYSLGVTMYQLLTGKLPYDGDSLANLTYNILQGKHPSVRSHRQELPASATRITNKALQKEPAERYQTAKEMADALRKSLARDFQQ
ncbi:serine/threonine protein kinase [Simiduia sp. 21SJ11W-1]|uniref:serine/threonine-protein kinase n=1 Tax=Simiduia sp. 21SJ11W-1 TaxID=2909669 RepID=UPI0020A07529|nr:serine/threonine-protein kinase [Simiduia sp. 21SJ11W-1]UTA49192.1 serine/threonine protein kinase [Simiduia sp. 21SJ11W-1]